MGRRSRSAALRCARSFVDASHLPSSADPLVLQPALAQADTRASIEPAAAPPLDTLPMSGLTPAADGSSSSKPTASSITPPQDGTSHLKKSPLTPPSVGGNASAPTVSYDLDQALARPGDLTLRNSTLQDALFTISELWHINIVAGDVHGSVNGVFKAAPLREILGFHPVEQWLRIPNGRRQPGRQPVGGRRPGQPVLPYSDGARPRG